MRRISWRSLKLVQPRGSTGARVVGSACMDLIVSAIIAYATHACRPRQQPGHPHDTAQPTGTLACTRARHPRQPGRRPRAEHLNPMGTVHGGWFATLLDSALGCSIHTRMEPGRGYTTAELGINLVKAITPKVQRVRAEGRVIHSGRQLATAEARLVGPDGTLYAHATTTCLVFDLPAQSKG